MRIPVTELILTAVLGAAFAAVGERILRRRPLDIAEWNESLWVGMAVCAVALFPLSLAFGPRALILDAAVLTAALVYSAVDRLRRPGRADPGQRPHGDPAARAILAAVAVPVAGFIALNFRYTYLWDGFMIWATKAQLLFQTGQLTRSWFIGDFYDLRHLAYPPLVSLCEALLVLRRGAYDFDPLKPIFLLFYLSMLVGTYSAVRAAVSARYAAAATLLLALLPLLSARPAVGGYADMPQAAAAAALFSAAMRRAEASIPWLIGALTTVKSEGTVLAAIACLAGVYSWVLESPGLRELGRRTIENVRGAFIVAVFFGLRLGYVRWIDAPYEVYEGSVSVALHRIPRVAAGCARELVDPRQWGLFWPAFFLAATALFAFGSSPRIRAATAAVVLALVTLMIPFLVTKWPVALQVEQAYTRLVSQVAPVAASLIALGMAASLAHRRTPSVLP